GALGTALTPRARISARAPDRAARPLRRVRGDRPTLASDDARLRDALPRGARELLRRRAADAVRPVPRRGPRAAIRRGASGAPVRRQLRAGLPSADDDAPA